MNWTGGRLQRHSGPADTALTRQKQHFAKVKAKLLLGNKGTSVKAASPHGRHHGDIHRSAPKWSASRLAEIESFQKYDGKESRDSTRGAQMHESGMKDTESGRQRSHGRLGSHHEGRSNDQGSSYNKQRVDEYDYRDRSPPKPTHRRHIPEPTLGVPSRFQDASRRIFSIKREPSPDDDLYSATPPPRSHFKREREGSESVSDHKTGRAPQMEESMSAKRRRLVMKGDWVGVEFQRPPQHTFTASRAQDKVAKRRRITDGHQARYSSKQAILSSPFVTKRRLPLTEIHSIHQSPRAVPGRSDVRISIGGRVVPPGISSSSVQSKRTSFQRTSLPDRPPTRSSDVMLLDNEQGIYHGVDSQRTQPAAEGAFQKGERKEHRPAFQYLSRSLDGLSREASSRTSSQRQMGNERNIGLVYEPTPKRNIHLRGHRHVQSRSDRTHSSTELVRRHSRSISNHTFGSARPDTPLNYSSSASVSLQHPKPRSSRVSSILKSDSTRLDTSTIAQVGRERPVVPDSQILDNEIWESWLAPLQTADSEAEGGSPNANRVSISPGMSAAPTYRPTIKDPSSDIILGISSSESPYPFDDNSEALILPENVSVQDHRSRELSPFPKSRSPLISRSQSTEMASQKSLDSQPALTIAKPSLKTKMEPSVASKRLANKDKDDIWKQFVFGDEDDESGGEPAKPTTAPTARVNFASLMRAHLEVVNSTKPSVPISSRRRIVATTPLRQSDSSLLTSRTENSSPTHRKTDAQRSHDRAESPATMEVLDSARASGGSRHSWGSNSGLATVAATVLPRSSPGERTENSGFRMQKRVTFTKPKPFEGRKVIVDSSPMAEKPLHIGKSFKNRGDSKDLLREARRYDSVTPEVIESDDERAELESIEDD